jgi:hypothetical protein
MGRLLQRAYADGVETLAGFQALVRNGHSAEVARMFEERL